MKCKKKWETFHFHILQTSSYLMQEVLTRNSKEQSQMWEGTLMDSDTTKIIITIYRNILMLLFQIIRMIVSFLFIISILILVNSQITFDEFFLLRKTDFLYQSKFNPLFMYKNKLWNQYSERERIVQSPESIVESDKFMRDSMKIYH